MEANPLIRFDPLVRKGLRFRNKLDAARQANQSILWYPYDSFANLFVMARLLRQANLTLPSGNILDIGAADGALSFYFESLGHKVTAVDNSRTNINRMAGIGALATALSSRIQIRDVDLDTTPGFDTPCDFALFLGLLYHLKNPYGILENLAQTARYCFLSTRVARFSPDRSLAFENHPVAWLLDSEETNHDATNYWIFSPVGLKRLVHRCGWRILATHNTGAHNSDPVTPSADERMFLLLESARF